MKDAIYRISLDIHEHGSQAVLKVKKTDTGRKVHITLRGGGTPYTIEDDCYAVFKATKPDGSILYNACTIENNEIIYEFTEQTCTAVGRCRCEIALYGMDDKLITSPRFALLVDGTIYPDELVESTDEFSALTKLISDTMEATEAATQAAQSAENATQSAENATSVAHSAATRAADAADRAEVAEQIAFTAAESADRAAQRSNEAASAAETATTRADESADHANQVAEEVKNGAVLTSPQNLDEAKQKQARKNIGADALIVTVVTINSNMTASHTDEQIKAHIQKGGMAYLNVDDCQIPIFLNSDIVAAGFMDDASSYSYYEISGNKVHTSDTNFATLEHLSTVETAVGHTVRFTDQTLTKEQQAQARANIGAAAVGEIGGSLTATDDGNGNVVVTITGGISVTDDGNGNVVIA